MTNKTQIVGQTVLCWAVATPPELKAVRALRMLNRRVCSLPFAVYSNQQCTQWIVCTGVGQLNMAMGVGYLSALMSADDTVVWANVGLAGAQSKAIGSAWAIHQVECGLTDRRFHPGLIPIRGLASAVCRTVNDVERGYPRDVLYDMEAAGFFQALRKLTHVDAFALLKVVSDNRAQHVDSLTAKTMTQLLLDAGPSMVILSDQLLEIAEESRRRTELPRDFAGAVEVHPFSFSETIRLKKLLRRWSILKPTQDLMTLLNNYDRSSVLNAIETVLDESPIEVSHD
jgi:hypothetical protein